MKLRSVVECLLQSEVINVGEVQGSSTLTKQQQQNIAMSRPTHKTRWERLEAKLWLHWLDYSVTKERTCNCTVTKQVFSRTTQKTDSRKQDELSGKQQDGNLDPPIAMATPIRKEGDMPRQGEHRERDDGGNAEQGMMVEVALAG